MKMVTYIYWALVLGMMLAVVFVAGFKLNNLVLGLVGALVILAIGWAAYYFHFEQVFVKRWGGVMTITVPAGEHHIAATWKEDKKKITSGLKTTIRIPIPVISGNIPKVICSRER